MKKGISPHSKPRRKTGKLKTAQGVLSAVGSFNSPTSAGDKAVTGLAFQPKAIFFFYNAMNSSGWGNDIQVGYGMTAGSAAGQNAAVSAANMNGATTVHEHKRNTYQKCISLINFDGSTLLEAALKSFDSSGFTVTFSTANATAFIISYLALGGDITNATLTQWQTPNNGATTPVSCGFSPDAMIHITDENTAANSTSAAVALGVAFSASGYGYSQAVCSKSSTTTQTCRAMVGGPFVDLVWNGAGYSDISVTATDDGFSAYGFDGGSGGQYVYTLALKLVDPSDAMAFSYFKAAATSESVVCGKMIDYPNFPYCAPSGILMINTSQGEDTDCQAGLRFSLGASDGTNNHMIALQDKNNVTTTVCRKCTYTNKVLTIGDNDAGTDTCTGSAAFSTTNINFSYSSSAGDGTSMAGIAFGKSVYDVNVAGVTATANYTANVPLVGVATIPPTASASITMNVANVTMNVIGVTATVVGVANVPTVNVGVPGITASPSLSAIVGLVGVSPVDASNSDVVSIAQFGANVAAVQEDVVFAGITSIMEFTVNIPATSAAPGTFDVDVVGVLSHMNIGVNVPQISVGAPSTTATVDFTANMPAQINVGVEWLAPDINFDANVPLIGVGVMGQTANMWLTATLKRGAAIDTTGAVYGPNHVLDPLLLAPNDPDDGNPQGWSIVPVGTVSFDVEWETQPWFTGNTIHVMIYSQEVAAQVIINSPLYDISRTYPCNLNIEPCDYDHFQIMFEYRASEEQTLTINYYDEYDALLSQDSIVLPNTGLRPMVWSTVVGTPGSTAKIQLVFTAEEKPVEYAIGNIRINQWLYSDVGITGVDITRFAEDRIAGCFVSDVYDPRDNPIQSALLNAIATEIDMARAITMTTVNNTFISYANGTVLDQFGNLFNLHRWDVEVERDALYRSRLKNLWVSPYGGGNATWLQYVLEHFTNCSVVLQTGSLPPTGQYLTFELIDTHEIPQPCEQTLSDTDLTRLLRREAMAGVFVYYAPEQPGPGEIDGGFEGCIAGGQINIAEVTDNNGD